MSGSIRTAILNTLGLYKVERVGGKNFYTIGGLTANFWGDNGYDQYIKDFSEIPELNAVINYKARAESRVKFEIVSKETGKPVKNNEPIVRVLRRPNWFQTTQEWLYQTSLYKSIFGNEYHYFLTPYAKGTEYKAIYTLPPQNVFIKCDNRRFFMESGMPDDVQYYFKLRDDRTITELPINDILHLNNNRITHIPDSKNQSETQRTNYLYGTSKIASLTPVLKNIRQAYEGRNTLRNLPAAIMSNAARDAAGTAPMVPAEKEELQQNLKKYGLSVEQNQIIITSLALNMRETIVDIGKLKLFEEVKEDASKICDAFGVPFELVGSDTGVTYENKKQAERQLYEDTIIPEMAERLEALNYKLGTDSKIWHIVGYYDHLTIFQENQVERAQTLNTVVTALNTALQAGAIDIEIFKKELAKLGIS